MNSSFDEVLTLSQNPDGPLDLTVTHCSFIRLTDKAFQRKPTDDREDRWDQNHLGLVRSTRSHAFLFALLNQLTNLTELGSQIQGSSNVALRLGGSC